MTTNEKYLLELYVTGMTPRSTSAIVNITELLNKYLPGNYELEVIDLFKQPASERDKQIVAVPTLIKRLPLPIRKYIGDMSDTEQILVGLDLMPKEPE